MGGKSYDYNLFAANVAKRVLGDKNAQVYYVEHMDDYVFDPTSFEY